MGHKKVAFSVVQDIIEAKNTDDFEPDSKLVLYAVYLALNEGSDSAVRVAWTLAQGRLDSMDPKLIMEIMNGLAKYGYYDAIFDVMVDARLPLPLLYGHAFVLLYKVSHPRKLSFHPSELHGSRIASLRHLTLSLL